MKSRLPPEDSSDRRETLGKRVSNDSRHSIFDAQKNFSAVIFFQKKNQVDLFFQESGVLEELWLFGRDGQMRLDK